MTMDEDVAYSSCHGVDESVRCRKDATSVHTMPHAHDVTCAAWSDNGTNVKTTATAMPCVCSRTACRSRCCAASAHSERRWSRPNAAAAERRRGSGSAGEPCRQLCSRSATIHRPLPNRESLSVRRRGSAPLLFLRGLSRCCLDAAHTRQRATITGSRVYGGLWGLGSWSWVPPPPTRRRF